MSREEKRRKFHEAVLNMLYPPPPQPQTDEDSAVVNNLNEGFDPNLVPDDLGETSSNSSSSSDNGDEGESGSQKLGRAQRKRLRKKKLKIDACRRGQIIGPLLAPAMDDDNSGLENEPPTVRRNAAEEPASAISEKAGELPPTCSDSKSKVKQRRIAKKVARKSLLASPQKRNFHQDQQSCNQE